jgi:hypothetical protein
MQQHTLLVVQVHLLVEQVLLVEVDFLQAVEQVVLEAIVAAQWLLLVVQVVLE